MVTVDSADAWPFSPAVCTLFFNPCFYIVYFFGINKIWWRRWVRNWLNRTNDLTCVMHAWDDHEYYFGDRSMAAGNGWHKICIARTVRRKESAISPPTALGPSGGAGLRPEPHFDFWPNYSISVVSATQFAMMHELRRSDFVTLCILKLDFSCSNELCVL